MSQAAPDSTVSVGRPGASFPLMARIVGVDGVALSQSVVESIAYRVWTSDGSEAVQTGTLTKTDVIYNTLQTDDWDVLKDASGYNFRWNVPGTLFRHESRQYRIRVAILGTSAAGSHTVFLLHRRQTLSWNEG